MKILIASMMHESNTFSTMPTDIDAFKRTQYLIGEELINYHKGKRTEIGGMLGVFEKNGVDVIPSVSAWAIPSGAVTKKAYGEIKNRIINDVRANLPNVDGVLLALHGSMVVEGIEDPEGDLMKAIRKVLPRDSHLAASLDMHAHLTTTMVENSEFFVGYRTHPHVDQYETGQKAAHILMRLIKEKLRLAKGYVWIPMLVPGENQDEPRKKLISAIANIEKDPKVITGSIFISHPWGDLSIQGDSVLVVTSNDQELADKYANDLANKFWELRHDFPLDLYSVQQAVKIGLESKKRGPLVICEMGECLLGGASGDVVTTISYLIQRGIENVAVAVVVDPESVAKAVKAGIGSTVKLNIGGKLFKEGNPPLPFEGKVNFIGKDVEAGGDILVGYETKMGRMVVVEGYGVEIVLVERTGKIGDPSLFEKVGINLKNKKFIILKESIGPLISYRDIASNVLLVDTPGWCTQMLYTIDYKRIPRPMFPLDPTMSWHAG